MGIIESLSAGYRFLGRRIELILIPVLLDLAIWLLPQLSIAPIIQRVADAYMQLTSGATVPAGMDELPAQMTQMLTDVGQSVNLLTALVSSALLHVPSISGALTPPMTRDPIMIYNSGVSLLIWAGLSLLGLFIGVVYLQMLARVLPLGAGSKSNTLGEFMRNAVRHFGKVVVYVLLFGVITLVAMVPISLLTGMVMLVAPALSTTLMAVAGGFFLVLLVYLYFVTAAIVLDDAGVTEAIARSVQLVRKNFLPVLGFAAVVTVIGLGIGLLMAQIADTSAIAAILAIVINAWIGTGLTMALLVFYRSRVLMAAQAQTVDASPS